MSVTADDLTERERTRLEFLRSRQKGIGGSDVAAILGYSNYADARDVYHSKTRPIEPEDVKGDVNPDAERGIDLEPVCRRKYREVTGRRGRQWEEFQHPDHPHFVAHVDWSIFGPDKQPEGVEMPEGAEGAGIAEFKAPSIERFKRLAEYGMADREYLQGLWYLGVTRRRWLGYAFYNPNGREESTVHPHLVTPDIVLRETEQEVIRYLQDKMDEFWRKHVEERREPDPSEWDTDPAMPDVPDDVGEYRTVHPDELPEDAGPAVIKAAERAVELAREYADAREERMDAEDREDAAKEAFEEWFDEWGQPVFGTRKIEVPGVGKIATVIGSGTNFDESGLRGHEPIDRDAFVRWYLSVVQDDEQAAQAAAEELTLDLDHYEDQYKYSYVRMY